jgi:hypothetical protein
MTNPLRNCDSEIDFFCKRGCPTVCVTGRWAGVDNAWEQRKLEARKMLENAAESHLSSARFVRRFLLCNTRRLKKDDILLGLIVMFQSNEF